MSAAIDKINDAFLQANYEADKQLQKILKLVKTWEKGGEISRFTSPWREKFNSLCLDNRNFLYLDNRLVLPSKRRASIVSAIHCASRKGYNA